MTRKHLGNQVNTEIAHGVSHILVGNFRASSGGEDESRFTVISSRDYICCYSILSLDLRIQVLGDKVKQFNLPQVHVMMLGAIRIQKYILWEAFHFDLVQISNFIYFEFRPCEVKVGTP